jgi:hypothetical protein
MTLLALVAALAVAAGNAAAQGTARSLDLDTSVRSLGRGGASNAVFWDGGNEWANPALLGYRRGFSVTWDYQALIPELAEVSLSSRRVSLGLWGMGFSTAGQPVDVIGGTDLDYGPSEGADPAGNPVDFRSFEHIRSWGFGASLAGVFDEASARFGRTSTISDWADIAVGLNQKRVEVAFFPPVSSGTDATDIGIFARVSPLDTRRSGKGGVAATHRLDVAIAHSVINSNDAYVDFGILGGPVSISRIKRDGVSLGWTKRASPEAVKSNRKLWRILGPDHALWRAVLAFDREHVSAGDDELNSYDVDRWGAEVSMGRVCALRLGHVLDREGEIDGFSVGLGLGVPLGPLAELAYDFASIPQATELDHRYAHSLTVRLDVLEMLKHWREEAPDAVAN